MTFKFNKELYPKIALLKAAYSFIDVAYIHLDNNDSEYVVDFVLKDTNNDIREQDFLNEMINQSLRHEIYLQTKTVREMLVARAVASTVIDVKDNNHIDN